MEQRQIGVGIIGCGTISDIYLTNLTQHYKNVNVIACADMFPEKAEQTRQKYSLQKSCTVEELLADPDIQLVVNLTIPAAHQEINMLCLYAGKHVYCEKPLALTLEDAREAVELAHEKGLMLAAAPDTFLGAGMQTSRKLLDEGVIGSPIGFTANLVGPGHEHWHPSPLFYYKKGGGPMLDMGPYYITALVQLLGPIRLISCMARTTRALRDIQGKQETVEVPTHYIGLVEFQNGVIGNVNMSFDVWHSNLPQLEIFGTEGMLTVPDPNMFGGPVLHYDGNRMKVLVGAVEGPYIQRLIRMNTCTTECLTKVDLPYPAEDDPRSNMRGFGVSDMAQSLLDGRPSRMTGDVAVHVVEALTAFEIANRENRPYAMTTSCNRPASMPVGLPLWVVD